MTRQLGGRAFAIGVACIAVLVVPHYLGSQAKLATDSLEPPFWAACLYYLLRIIREQDVRLWLWFGLFAGLGIEVKHSIVFFGFALLAALLFTDERRLIFCRYFVYAGLVAFVLALPNLIWEWRHHWATYELLANISHSNKNVVLSPWQYFAQQWLIIGPASSLLWFVGWFALAIRRDWREYRVFPLAYAFLLVIFIVLKGKNYYLAPIYPVLFAGGAVWFESVTDLRLRWLRPIYVVLLIAFGLLVLPLTLPLLSPENYVRYQTKLHIPSTRTETGHNAILPQHFADRFGWDELATNMDHAFHLLTPEEQKKVGIFAQNYGEAGAIDVLGHGLPPALSGHQNYFLWGPRGYTGELLLVVDDDPDSLHRLCASVEDKGPAIRNEWAMPFERQRDIYLCRGLHPPLPQLWPKLKFWY